jgi:UDP-N-acetylglucosamine:LPS N-acetylglucosamine transferase
VRKNVKYVNHLAAKQLEEAIHSSVFVIARSGYSTVMDLIKLQKKTILIPTPGQTEQEYLAKHLFSQKLAFAVDQENFDLEKALDAAKSFQYSFFNRDDATLLQEALAFKNFLKSS